jgi:hypothetical protein
MTNSNLLFAIWTGILPAVPQTISQAFERSSMHVQATLSQIIELEAAIKEEKANPRCDDALIHRLSEQCAEAEERLFQLERNRLCIYRAMVAEHNARMAIS